MQIKIVSVTVEYVKNPGKKQGYDKAEIVYRDERNEVKTKNIVSFANPAVFAAIKDAQTNDVFNVESTQDAKGYYQWTSITKSDGAAPAPAVSKAGSQGSGAPIGTGRSNFETPEERALRQRLIVRQSSLSTAVEVLTTGAKTAPDKDAVFTLAEEFYDWVYQKPDLFDQPNDLNTDIPV
jgi:hypothetical protein